MSDPPADLEPGSRPAALAITGLTKSFGAVKALDDVDLSVRAGEIHALLGQNGAGKSTLIKILAGIYEPDEGSMSLDKDARRRPVAFIHQDLGLVDTMTVAENVSLVAGYRRRGGLIDWAAGRRAAAECLAAIGSPIDPEIKVAVLSAAERALVAIARAMALKAELVVLDEPTAALHDQDVTTLLQTLRALRSRGIGILYVTHRLDEVFRVADRVTVLRDGRRVWTGTTQSTTPAELVFQIVGRQLSEIFPPLSSAGESPVLMVEDLVIGETGPLSFTAGAGEIVGLVGLRGAGQEGVGRALAGVVPIRAGSMQIGGSCYRPRSPADAVAAGVGFVSSRRMDESIVPNLSLRENLFPNLFAGGRSRWSVCSPSWETARAAAVLRQYDVRPPAPARVIASLSGGNQQKIVLARWIEAGRRLLVLEEPTAGVDVGSKSDIYRLLHRTLAAGLSVLVVSSDLSEVAGLCHRALVFDQGRIVATLEGPSLTVANLISAAAGATSVEADHVNNPH